MGRKVRARTTPGTHGHVRRGRRAPVAAAMARGASSKKVNKRVNKAAESLGDYAPGPGKKRPIEQYEHPDKKRPNNPPVGLVTPQTDRGETRKAYAYDPHLDPRLEWAGKAERTSFEVPTVSLHVHERIDPKTIIQAVKRRNGTHGQPSLFDGLVENPPLREALDFYKHPHNWSNRLIAGDSLLVMNSLIEKEGLAGKVQMIYLDPPYGIKYGSNFQPFVNKRDVKDRADADLTQEPEMIKAFRDTWELGIHSYLAYLRDRLLLANELLSVTGSVFVQISDENVHHVRELMDSIFGPTNFVSQVVVQKTGGFTKKTLATIEDYIVWYARDISQVRYRDPRELSESPPDDDKYYRRLQLSHGGWRWLTPAEASDRRKASNGGRIFRHGPLNSDGPSASPKKFTFNGIPFECNANRHWTVDAEIDLPQVARSGHVFQIG